jgi:uncharacterized protein
MFPAGNLIIPVEHGQLEAILKAPSEVPSRGAALVLHPHPLGGGTMHNKVVFRAAAALNDAGLVALRINFRGVGRSTGKHDGGRGELDDARAGLNYLATHYTGDRLLVCGFSFGARVGMEVGLNDERVGYLISIGTPINVTDFSFLESCRKPLLFVHGDRDEFGDIDRVRALVATLTKRTAVKLVVIPGASHFFEGHLDDLKTAISDWTNEALGR